MAHHRLGHQQVAQRSFQKATPWLSYVPGIVTGDLAKLRTEAGAVRPPSNRSSSERRGRKRIVPSQIEQELERGLSVRLLRNLRRS